VEATLKIWAIIVVVGALNYLSRLSFIALFSRRTMPPLAVRALRYVPAAMLTALILPMIVGTPGETVHLDARVPATIVAAAVAFRTRSTLWTLVAGMAALWLLRIAFPGLG
jgi:branched-subunit amino acid transport protein